MSEKNHRNPLSVILGAYLKRERNSLRTSSGDMASKLKLGDSIYRMIEAGSANLNINRASLVAASFYESRIKFERLTKYLASIQILDFELAEKSTLQHSLELLSERDEDVESFITRTAHLYTLQHGTTEYRKVLDEIAINELDSFLGDENYRVKEASSFNKDVVNTLLGVPSIELPNILTFLKSLNNRRPLHVGPIAAEWEEDTKDNLVSLIGVYFNLHLIINPDNLELFMYDFLTRSKFITLKMLYVGKDLNADHLKKKFVQSLNATRSKYKRTTLTETQIKKIEFKAIEPNNPVIDKIRPLLQERDDIFSELKAYWNFTHDSGVEISFVGGADGAKNYAINLPYLEASERSKELAAIWNSLK